MGEFGDCPEVEQIQELIENQTIQSKVDLEAWLFKWEFENFQDAHRIRPPVSEDDIWYDPGTSKLIILLLPTPNSWETLAYLHWWGAMNSGTTIAIALLKEWWQIYEAELVHHYGTMLQFIVGKPPIKPEDAFELAWEQVAIAPWIVQAAGIHLRTHARFLIAANRINRWFVHEKP